MEKNNDGSIVITGMGAVTPIGIGVEEYWVVDLQKERITVYLFEDELITMRYGLYDKVPVSVWDGKCVVDLSEAREKIDYSAELDAEPDLADEEEEARGVGEQE